MIWCMDRTNIYLESEQAKRLDRLAKQEGTSRAELIRRLLDRAMAGHDGDLDSDLAAIDVSFGAFADIEVTSRHADDRERHLARMWEIRP